MVVVIVERRGMATMRSMMMMMMVVGVEEEAEEGVGDGDQGAGHRGARQGLGPGTVVGRR